MLKTSRMALAAALAFLPRLAAAAPAPAPDDLVPAAEQLRGSCQRSLLPGLKRSPAAITMREYDVIGRLAKDRRIRSIVYLNRFGEVRWARQAELWTMTFEQLGKQAPLPTDAASRALKADSVVVAPAARGVFEAALPLDSDGQVQGVLDIQSDAKGILSLGADARKSLKRDAAIRPAPVRTAPAKSPESERQAQQFYLSGLIYYHKGDSAKALSEWTHARQLDPGNPDIPQALKRLQAR
jgi:hypothetical protein